MAKIQLTKDEIMKYVKECWDTSDNHWTTYEKPEWDLSYQLYNNIQDFSEKEDWQSKNFIPKTEGNVDTTVNLVGRAFRAVKKWLQVEGIEETDRDAAPDVQKLAKFWADLIRLVDTVLSTFRTSLIASVGIVKTYDWTGVVWEWIDGEYQPINGWRPKVDEVDPYDFRVSRDMQLHEGKLKGTYCIERKEEEFTDLKLNADNMGYDISEVREEDFPKKGEEQKGARDLEKEGSSDIRHPVEIKEFHGYVRLPQDESERSPRGKGEELYDFEENLKYVITYANDKNLLRVSGQSENEYSYPRKNQEYVYQVIRPFPANFKFYGKSLVQSLARLQIMLNDIWNMNFDNLNWVINKLFGVDMTLIEDSDDLNVKPGALIRGKGKINEFLQNLLVGDMPRASTEIPAMIEHMMDRSSGVTPQVQAGLSQMGSETATEFAGLMQQSTLKFESMAQMLQSQVGSILEAFVELVLETDHEDAWLTAAAILGPESTVKLAAIRNMSPKFDIKVTAISGYVNKMQTSNKLLALLNILGPLVPVLGINIRPIVRGILRANEDVLDDIDEIFPDVPMLDINTIISILQKINPTLPQIFMATIQAMAPGQGGAGQGGLRREAQPAKEGLPETMLSPTGWAAGGGPQG